MIRLEGIRRDFQVGDQVVHALRDINLEIPAGDYVSIMGPSGSGKSTLLNVLGLLDTPSGGRYWLNGNDTSQQSDDELARTRQAEIGFVFQFFHLIARMTAFENVELPLLLAGVDPARRRQRTTSVLADMGLTDRMHHRPDQLSGGQRQRVAIGRAIVMQPRVLLADEPTGNLDSQSGREVIDIIERLNQDGLTLIVVTHDAEVGRRARRHLKLIDGAVASDSTSAGLPA